jgi:hypothetical protein
VSASQSLDATPETVRKISWVSRAPQCLLGNGLDICKCVFDTMVELIEQEPLRIRCPYQSARPTQFAQSLGERCDVFLPLRILFGERHQDAQSPRAILLLRA